MNERLNGHSGTRIALPAPTSTDNGYNQRAWTPYFHSLQAAGAVPVPIPLNESLETVEKLAASCSGILLPGSPADVNPDLYGQEPKPDCGMADAAREAVDALLLKHGFETGKPVFGICYGLQSLNVWKGGTLIQHIPVRTRVDHDPGSTIANAHRVQVEDASRLAVALSNADDAVPALRGLIAVVNSSHHQAVDRSGDGLSVSATCLEDGGIEALEGTDAEQFVLAVQWHPERTYDISAASRELFRAFVAAAEQHSRKPSESLAR